MRSKKSILHQGVGKICRRLNIASLCKCVVALWIMAQIVLLIVFWRHPQGSDQGEYMRMAIDCYNRGVWYPDAAYLYEGYIWAPGLVNYFILQLRIFGTLDFNPVFNLLMNIGIVFDIFIIAAKWFSRRTAYIAVILYCLIYSNAMVILPAGTEVPFLFLIITGFTLTLRRSGRRLAVAGVLFALANWIRPLTIIFLPAVLVYFYIKRYKAADYAALLLPLVLLTTLIGLWTKSQIGHFVFQSTTASVNLIMTANDRAYGGVASSLLRDPTSSCYIEDYKSLTYAQEDSIWRARAIDWILRNPEKYAGLYLLKIPGLYVEDSWADRPLLGGDGAVEKAMRSSDNKAGVAKRLPVMAAKSLVYYVMLALFIIAVVRYRREWRSEKGLLLLIVVTGTLVTCVFAVSPRYHYPWLFAMVIWAAYGLDMKTSR